MNHDDLFKPVPVVKVPANAKKAPKDPFEEKDIALPDKKPEKVSFLPVDEKDIPSEDQITSDIPFLRLVEQLPGVSEAMPHENNPNLATYNKRITLRGMNEDVKDFTDDIKSKREELADSGELNRVNFFYDVEAVRIFGQYGATAEEMAAYFSVDKTTITKLMSNKESDFFKVYQKAYSLLCMSLRQAQIRSAMSGSERMMVHLGNSILKQNESSEERSDSKELPSEVKDRRMRITTLTQRIEEFDVQ